MILVSGSTGYVGGHVCRSLLAHGQAVRALVRASSDAGRMALLREAGAELAIGNLRDAASLARACRGAEVVISTASASSAPRDGDTVSNVDGAGQIALIDAAREAGVRHFIFVSYSGGLQLDCPLHTAKRSVEAHLRASGMTWTVLRPTAFMEVWLSPQLGFDVPNGVVTIYGSGGAPVSYISLHDVARFCVDVVGNAAAANAVLELGGPDAVTPLQAVRIAEDVSGRQLDITHVPVEALEAQYNGAIDPLQKSFAALMLGLANGDVIDMRSTLRVFPGTLRSVRHFMQEAYGRPQPLSAGVD